MNNATYIIIAAICGGIIGVIGTIIICTMIINSLTSAIHLGNFITKKLLNDTNNLKSRRETIDFLKNCFVDYYYEEYEESRTIKDKFICELAEMFYEEMFEENSNSEDDMNE